MKKTALFLTGLALALCSHAANPTYNNFDTNNFQTDGLTVWANTNADNPKALVSQEQNVAAFAGKSSSSTATLPSPVDFEAFDLSWKPSLIGITGTFQDSISAPDICFFSNKVYVVYVSKNAGVTNASIAVSSATSISGLTNASAPALTNRPGTFFSGYVDGPRWYQEAGTNYILFFGSTNAANEAAPAQIGIAYSTDMVTWTYNTNALITNTPGTFDSVNIFRPFLMKNNGTYYLFWNGSDGSKEQIGFATASNIFGPYMKYAGNPVLGKLSGARTNLWNGLGDGDPFIIPARLQEKVGWAMLHMGFGPNSSWVPGVSVSYDLTNWFSLTNPISFSALGPLSFVRPSAFQLGGRTLVAGDGGNGRIYVASPRASVWNFKDEFDLPGESNGGKVWFDRVSGALHISVSDANSALGSVLVDVAGGNYRNPTNANNVLNIQPNIVYITNAVLQVGTNSHYVQVYVAPDPNEGNLMGAFIVPYQNDLTFGNGSHGIYKLNLRYCSYVDASLTTLMAGKIMDANSSMAIQIVAGSAITNFYDTYFLGAIKGTFDNLTNSSPALPSPANNRTNGPASLANVGALLSANIQPGSQISGQINPTNLPPNVVTNGATGASFTNAQESFTITVFPTNTVFTYTGTNAAGVVQSMGLMMGNLLSGNAFRMTNWAGQNIINITTNGTTTLTTFSNFVFSGDSVSSTLQGRGNLQLWAGSASSLNLSANAGNQGWWISTGALYPDADGARDLGTTAARVGTGYLRTVNTTNLIFASTNVTVPINNLAVMGSQFSSDGTNVFVVFRNAAGTFTTNKVSLSAYP